ncbi:alpha/beta hydrolase [Chitinimonas sp. JJ19]|uniref:alpha/beta hydrolase n=1 Tax=Chitinimonas sp. JJ19 TaxID=3109352 RepID=UPI001A3E19AD|nr:alpha/beta hydrolase [Chitinimonas sp.]
MTAAGLASTLLRIALGASGAIVLLWLLLYLLQERLLFQPQPLDDAQRTATGSLPGTETLSLVSPEGHTLRGWLRKPAQTGPWPLLLYFGGNAEEVSHILAEQSAWPGWAIATLNYRGFGDSQGEAGEAALRADALLLYDHLSRRSDVQAGRIVAMGRSMGSGVAVALAAERKLSGLVLITPYDSLTAVAQRHYRWVPVRWLLRHRFDSAAQAPQRQEPALFLVAGEDQLIPKAHAQRLHDAWRGSKIWVELPNTGHGDLSSAPAYDAALRSFLQGIAQGTEGAPRK